tara:strand:- start:5273 stop:6823 length:1551 start_codon:yes stop_codon:yes gene_type:complete
MEICDKYLHDLILINPTLNDMFQFEKYKDKKHIQPNIYSENHYKELYQLDKKYLRILNKKKKKTINDLILQRDLLYNTKMEKGYKIYMYMPVNTNENILFDYITECSGNGTYFFNSRKDYHDFMNRLKSLTPITEEIIQKMKTGIHEKVCLPRKTVDKMIEKIQVTLSEQTYKHTINNRKPKDWNDSVHKYLVTNLESFLSFLLNDYYLHTKDILGLCSYVGGKDAYINIIQYETYNNISPDQVYQLGKKELNRLMKEKKRLHNKLNINAIDKYSYSNEKDILNDLKKIREKIRKTIFPKYFHGKINNKELYQIKKISRENDMYFAYYRSKKHNRFQGEFYMNTFDPKKVNRYELYVLSLHEGIPGHHYESLTNYRNKNISDYLRFGYDSYIEGWAMYCENLGDYKDDLHYYFKIQYEINRSLRLLLDTGIHYFHWDYNKCKRYMKKYLTNDEERIHNDILRYMNNPGQAITYKIGEKAFLYFRNKLLEQGIPIKDIHQILLNIGPCPIEIMKELL